MSKKTKSGITRVVPIERTRNIGIAAHVDAGKTTLTERILFHTGTIHEPGEVDLGSTTTDFDPIERRRGITITAAAIPCSWAPKPERQLTKAFADLTHRINLIDTPGHVDFTAEVERCLRVLDGAIVVFSGVEGVQPQSEKVWRQATRYGVPRIAFVNKMDRLGADFARAVSEIRAKLGANAWPVLMPLGQEDALRGVIDVLNQKAIVYDPDQPFGVAYGIEPLPDAERAPAGLARRALVEALADIDASIADGYLAGRELGVRELQEAIRRQTLANRFVPVAGGSAYRFVGVQALLDAVVAYLPNPADLPPAEGIHPDTHAKVAVPASDSGPMRALVFKLTTDEFSRRHVFARVYSGILRAGDTVLNAVTGKRERISRIYEIRAEKEIPIEAAFAGDIAVVAGLKEVATGHTLCSVNAPILLEPPSFPVPVMSMAIEPQTRADQERMGWVLERLVEDDPTLKVQPDPETGQTLIAGMGELHLEVVRERMQTRFKVATRAGAPQIAYRESVSAAATGEGKQIKQTGGRGQYGHVVLEVRPAERGSGLAVVDKVNGSHIPRQFVPAVKKGILGAAQCGILGGHPVVDLQALIVDGSFHPEDSNDLAFEIAGSFAFQDAVAKAKPVLLEPIMSVECLTPPEYQGDIVGDLQQRRGKVRRVDIKGDVIAITAEVPLAELFGYANAIRSLSKGRAEYSMEPARFEVMPPEITARVLEGLR